MTRLGLTLWAWFDKLNRTFRGRIAIITTGVIAFLSALVLALRFNKLNRKFHDHMAITITGVIVFLSAPALALMSYGVHAFLGAGTTGNGDSHKVAIPVAVTWAIQTNKENKGDRIILSAADTVRLRFFFDDVSNDPTPEKVPLPRPRPDELIALDAPPVESPTRTRSQQAGTVRMGKAQESTQLQARSAARFHDKLSRAAHSTNATQPVGFRGDQLATVPPQRLRVSCERSLGSTLRRRLDVVVVENAQRSAARSAREGQLY